MCDVAHRGSDRINVDDRACSFSAPCGGNRLSPCAFDRTAFRAYGRRPTCTRITCSRMRGGADCGVARGNPLNLDAVGALHGLGQVVVHLQTEPYFLAATEGLGKTYGHFRRDSGFAVHKVVKGLARDAETFRRFLNGEA